MTSISEILDLLARIPSTFWGVVAGSTLTLGGVVLTNRATDRRTRRQAENDRELRRKQRELELRKEIYLSAAEAISAGLRTIGNLSNIDLPDDQIAEPYVQKAPEIAKIHIIGNEETLDAAATVSSELQGAFMRLIVKRIPLRRLKDHITDLNQQIIIFGKERDHILVLMRDHNIEGNPDQRRFKSLQGNFDFNHNQVIEKIKERDKTHLLLYRGQLDLANECLSTQSQLALLVVPAVLAIRRELELPIDEEVYKRLMDQLLLKQQANTEEFIRRVRRLLDEIATKIEPNSVESAETQETQEAISLQ